MNKSSYLKIDRPNPMLKKGGGWKKGRGGGAGGLEGRGGEGRGEKEKSGKYILHKNVDFYHLAKCSYLDTVWWVKF